MTFSTQDHWRHYADFLRWEMAFGGPSTQLTTTREMIVGLPEEEQLWRVFCYLGVYNVPYGEVLWVNVPRDASAAFTEQWLHAAFASGRLITRIERRTVRRPEWLAEYLTGVRGFITEWPTFRNDLGSAATPEAGYECAWDRVVELPRVGRYLTIRTLEMLRRMGIPIRTPDIRPRDAWSPRGTLRMLFPDIEIGEDNSEETITTVNRTATTVLDRLATVGIDIDYYQLQVTLCEYRQSWKNRKQYPGRSLDSELGYARRAEEHYGHVSEIWEARRRLFPPRCLGEVQGWDGPRKPAGQVLSNHGYTWSDLVYDYSNTTDFAVPVRWAT